MKRLQEIWERIVGIVSKEQAGPLRNCGLTGSRGKRFLPLSSVHGNSQAHLPSYSMGLQALFPIKKQPRHEADHSPPSSVEAETNGAMPRPPHAFTVYTATTLPLSVYKCLYIVTNLLFPVSEMVNCICHCYILTKESHLIIPE